MPYFLLTFGDASRPLVAAVIIEASSMFQARMIVVARRLAPGVPFGEGLGSSGAAGHDRPTANPAMATAVINAL